MKYEPTDELKDYLATALRQRPDWAATGKILCGPLDPGNLRAAVDCMREGGVVVFFSELTYGIGTNALSPAGVAKLYEVKGRSFDKALAVIGTREKLPGWTKIPDNLRVPLDMLLDRYWPGGLNVVLPKSRCSDGGYFIPDHVTANMSSVALMCMDEVANAMARMAEFPIAATSANMSGDPPITDPIEAIETFADKVDKIMVGSSSTVGVNTTILDLCVTPPRILRPGPVSREDIARFLPEIA